MDCEKVTEMITKWIKEKVREAGAKGVVIGLSGGIDSAVTAVLAQKALSQNVLTLIMPCGSDEQDEKDARKISQDFRIDSVQFSLDDVHNIFLSKFSETSVLAQGNLKSRLRMCALYHVANLNNFLVLGTSNKTEIALGYYTKYGDGGVDLEPIGDLLKTEVRELAKYLGISDEIINKAPSAGLWEDQKDEEEIGMTYEELDATLRREQDCTEEVGARMRNSEHKRNMPPICLLI